MAKLYFKYGVMGSGKTTELLQIAHDYETAGKKVLIGKPVTDTKGNNYIVSRMANLSKKVDVMIEKTVLMRQITAMAEGVSIILIDEAQFLTPNNVADLVLVAHTLDIPVICFGLRTTFDGQGFTGASTLFALADQVEEISTRAICKVCGKRLATKNLRIIDGTPTFSGDTVVIDDNAKVEYMPVCTTDYLKIAQNEISKVIDKQSI